MARVLEEEDIMMVQENSSVIITQIQNSDYSMKGDSIMFMEDIMMVLTMETIQPIKMSTIKWKFAQIQSSDSMVKLMEDAMIVLTRKTVQQIKKPIYTFNNRMLGTPGLV